MIKIGEHQGYMVSISNDNALIRVEEAGETKSWKMMLDFCERFPTGYEPQWDSFIVRQSAIQNREIEQAVSHCFNSRTKERECH